MADAERVLVMGVMRSGTTLLSDSMSRPGESLVLSEPMLFSPWSPHDLRKQRMAAAITAHGFPASIGRALQATATDGSERQLAWFRQHLRPALEGLRLWGIKEVLLGGIGDLVDEVSPHHIIVCARDLRDVVLSSFDMICDILPVYRGAKYLRDEAWLMERLRLDIAQLLSRLRPDDVIVRYDDFVGDPAYRDAFFARFGLDPAGPGGTSFTGERAREFERFGGEIKATSAGRFDREPPGLARLLAGAIHREQAAYATALGLATPEPDDGALLLQPGAPDDVRVNEPGIDRDGFDLAYARRRARRVLSDNLPAGSRLLDVECGLPVLAINLRGQAEVLGIDSIRAGARQVRHDWCRWGVPGTDTYKDAAFLNILEYLPPDEIQAQLSRLVDQGVTLWVAYHCAEDRPEGVAASAGWQSALSRQDWVALAAARRAKVTPAWAFDGFQSFLRIQPVP